MKFSSALALIAASTISTSYASVIHLDTEDYRDVYKISLNKLKSGINYSVTCHINTDGQRILTQVSINGGTPEPYYYFNSQLIHFFTVVPMTSGTTLRFPVVNSLSSSIDIEYIRHVYSVNADCYAESLTK